MPGASPGTLPNLLGFDKYNPPKKGTAELLAIYSQSPWLRAIVNKIGRAVGDANWRLYALKKPNGRASFDSRLAMSASNVRQPNIHNKLSTGDVLEIPVNPLLELLSYGNEVLTGKIVLQLTAQYIDLVGEAFWVLDRNALRVPSAIWPVPPTWVRKLPTKSQPYYEMCSGNSGVVEVPEHAVIHFKEVDPADPYGRGTGIAKSLGDEIEIDEYAAKHVKSFFYNRARPDIIISGDNIGRDDTARLEEKWLQKHQGFMNAFKPMFFSRKIDIKELNQTMENMQMVELRKQERDTFISVFGIPPEVLGVIGDSKRSTIAMADLFWTRNIIAPRMEVLRDVLQRHLVPLFDDRLILDFDSPVIQDKEYKLEIMKAAAHAFTINDWRDAADTPSLGPAGDVLVVPMNSVSVRVKPPKTVAEDDLLESDEASFVNHVMKEVADGKPVLKAHVQRVKEILNR